MINGNDNLFRVRGTFNFLFGWGKGIFLEVVVNATVEAEAETAPFMEDEAALSGGAPHG